MDEKKTEVVSIPLSRSALSGDAGPPTWAEPMQQELQKLAVTRNLTLVGVAFDDVGRRAVTFIASPKGALTLEELVETLAVGGGLLSKTADALASNIVEEKGP